MKLKRHKSFLKDWRKINLTDGQYQKFTEQKESIVNLLSMPSSTDIEFNPEKLLDPLYLPVDLS